MDPPIKYLEEGPDFLNMLFVWWRFFYDNDAYDDYKKIYNYGDAYYNNSDYDISHYDTNDDVNIGNDDQDVNKDDDADGDFYDNVRNIFFLFIWFFDY